MTDALNTDLAYKKTNYVSEPTGYKLEATNKKCSNWGPSSPGGGQGLTAGGGEPTPYPTIAECAKACNNNSQCGGFYFTTQNKKCWLEKGGCNNVDATAAWQNGFHYKKIQAGQDIAT